MGWLLPNGNLFKDGAGNKTLTQNKKKKKSNPSMELLFCKIKIK